GDEVEKLFSLTDKVALVTGASRGIGASIARQMARAGASVVISSRKIEGLRQVAEEIEKAGGRALAVAAHSGKSAEVQALVRSAVDCFGQPDIPVNKRAN